MYCLEGSDPASLDWELEQNKIAKTSPAMGFTFDSSSVKTQYTAVNNVIKQYMPGLNCGSLDPDTEIEKFVKALDDAGYQDNFKCKTGAVRCLGCTAEIKQSDTVSQISKGCRMKMRQFYRNGE